MGNPNLVWDAGDAWTFNLIGFWEEGRLPLAELIRSANGVNPFVVADGLVEFTLGKLVGSGLVRIYDDWSMEATDEGAYLLEDVGFENRLANVLEQLRQVDPVHSGVKVPKRLLEASAD